MRFVANPNAAKDIARSDGMRRYMDGIAETAAAEVDRRKPNLPGRRAIDVTSDSNLGVDGWEGRVTVKSSFWHLHEFGSARTTAHPYLRTGVQTVLARIRGRWGSF